jgi:double-stranded uracil-DNA glycosylase
VTQREGLPDHIRPGSIVLFVGINPGLRSAETGHHFAGYSNRFWKLLYESQMIPEKLTFKEDWRLPEWGLGLTNIIRRPSAGADVLEPAEYRRGVATLERKIRCYQPQIIALLGVTIFRTLFSQGGRSSVSPDLGLTTMNIAGAQVFLLPNPSGRNAHYSYQQMLMAFQSLRHHMEPFRQG